MKASSHLLERLVPGSKVKVYKQAAHGLYYTNASAVMQDILSQINIAD